MVVPNQFFESDQLVESYDSYGQGSQSYCQAWGRPLAAARRCSENHVGELIGAPSTEARALVRYRHWGGRVTQALRGLPSTVLPDEIGQKGATRHSQGA